MAADFKATNDLKISSLFENRKDYRDNAFFEDGAWAPGVEDFYIDRKLSFYGRIDPNDNFVIPYKKTMKFFDSSQSPGSINRPRALNFVVDAYKGFIEDFERLLHENMCGITAEDINLSVVEAWKPVRYHVDMLYDAVHKNFLRSVFITTNKGGDIEKKINSLTTFEQFVAKMLQFYKGAGRIAPITIGGVLSSKHCFLNHTGLCITLTDSKLSDDTEKSVFMNKKLFGFYQQAAQQHGFMINRNVPWQIVANLTSHRMRSYMENRFTSPGRVWKTHYRRVHYIEIEDLKKRILGSWESFQTAFPTNIEREDACAGRTGATKISRRARYSKLILNKKHKNPFWLDILCNLKNSESDKPLPQISLDSVIKNAIKIENNLDMVSALDYINDQYKMHPINNRMESKKFLPDQEELALGQVSRYQSNVLIETATYYEDIIASDTTDSSY